MADDTITAIATAAGRGGIGIIKISGGKAIQIAAAIFQPAAGPPGEDTPNCRDIARLLKLDSHRLHFGHIYDRQREQVIDEVLMSVMVAPRSYTREDVVEINSHGGPLVMQTILKLVIANGARLAEPGEFTRRAFLNGRIDLTQAEAVIDLINARTERSLRAATAQMGGQLLVDVSAVRAAVVDILTRLDAAIDFPDEVDDIADSASLTVIVNSLIVAPIKRLIRHYEEGRILREGLQVALVGKPNVGKSSLLNRLVETDRAIVTDVPGTTRDVVTESIILNGIPVAFSDTAGRQQTSDPVEKIGIRKTMQQVERCDLVLFLVEAHMPPDGEDMSFLHRIQHRPHLIVINKIDLVEDGRLNQLPASFSTDHPTVAVSALRGDGLNALKDRILELTSGETSIDLSPEIIPNLRHKQLLDGALAAAEALCGELELSAAPELIAVHAREALDLLEEIPGLTVKTDILERIFDQFCIGK